MAAIGKKTDRRNGLLSDKQIGAEACILSRI
jgi:hypothetical protein